MKSILQWSHLRDSASGWSPWPWPCWKVTNAYGTRSTCCCRPPIGGNACYHWAKAQRENPMLSTVLNWLETTEDRFKGTSGRTHASSKEGNLIVCNWQNFVNSLGGLVPMLQCLRVKLKISCSSRCQGTSCCYLEWVPLRHRSIKGMIETLSFLWKHFWWPGMASQVQKLWSPVHALPATWWQVVQGAPTPDCVHCSHGSLACRLYEHRNDHRAKQYCLRLQMSWCSRTISQSTLWHTWPPTRLQRQLPSFCIRVTSWFLGPQPGS